MNNWGFIPGAERMFS